MDQHFVPRFYLDAWVDPTLPTSANRELWRLDLRYGNIRRASPRSVANQIDFNEYTDMLRGTRSLEDEYKLHEDAASPVLKAIRAGHNNPNDQQFQALMRFLALQVTRTPTGRKSMEQYLQSLGSAPSRDEVLDACYEAALGRFTQHLISSKWSGRIAREPVFITCDHPATLLETLGARRAGTHLIFPVTPSVVLIGCLAPINCRERHPVHYADEHILNRMVAISAQREIYAHLRIMGEYALSVVKRLKSEEHNKLLSLLRTRIGLSPSIQLPTGA